MNGVKWEPRLRKTLENSGATRFLAEGASLANATLTVDKGRGKVKLEQDAAGTVVLRFDDPQPGAALYEVTVRLSEAEDEALSVADEESASVPSSHKYETVKLADGTSVHVEKWAETFEAYDYVPPLAFGDPRLHEIVQYEKLGGHHNVPIMAIQVDAKHNRIYWCDGNSFHPVGHVWLHPT